MNSSRLVDRFSRYVTCASQSGNERQFCELIETELETLGLDVARDEGRMEHGRRLCAGAPWGKRR